MTPKVGSCCESICGATTLAELSLCAVKVTDILVSEGWLTIYLLSRHSNTSSLPKLRICIKHFHCSDAVSVCNPARGFEPNKPACLVRANHLLALSLTSNLP
jgi:hypothetical protein